MDLFILSTTWKCLEIFFKTTAVHKANLDLSANKTKFLFLDYLRVYIPSICVCFKHDTFFNVKSTSMNEKAWTLHIDCHTWQFHMQLFCHMYVHGGSSRPPWFFYTHTCSKMDALTEISYQWFVSFPLLLLLIIFVFLLPSRRSGPHIRMGYPRSPYEVG